jgi:hypothetical protein
MKPRGSLRKNWEGPYVQSGKQKWILEFGLYSWNIRTLYQGRFLRKLIDEMGKNYYKNSVDVLALQEMRWTGIVDEGKHIILCSGHLKKLEFGVGFL